MFKLDFKNIILEKHKVDEYKQKFNIYRDLVISRGQGFLDLPRADIGRIKSYANSVKGRYSTIVILGIGGSMLGPQTILGAFENSSTNPRVITIDNIDPYILAQTSQDLDLAETLFLVQTKSGSTPETISQYAFFRNLVTQKGLKVIDHFVGVTDPEQGYLREVGVREGWPLFSIPPNIGGRFSVLSPVGLLISELVGLDTQAFLEGAASVVAKYFFEGAETEIFELAISQYLLAKEGININVLMPYSSRLRIVSNWYTQLLSESIGKEFSLNQETVNTGITPVPALGATDQHSQLQLFKEGPIDKLIIFLEVQNFDPNLIIPDVFDGREEFSYLKNKSFNQLLKAELVGTRQSLVESKRPNLTITIDRVCEYSLGEIFMALELSVAFLGELLKINTFNQPGVERSKALAREILNSIS